MKALMSLEMIFLLIISSINSSYVNAQEDETHVFILWENAIKSKYSNQIIKDIKENFKVLDIYNISWTAKNFASNLNRLSRAPFYQEPKFFTEEFIKKRIKSNGMGPFLCIVVDVDNPVFEEKKTIGNGIKKVCTNVFNKKYFYRNLVKDFTIHATDDTEETNRNLTLLIGKSLGDFKKEHVSNWNEQIKSCNLDLIGANGWKDINEILYVLKNYYQNVYLTQDTVTSIHFSSEYSYEVKICTKCILGLESAMDPKDENQFRIKIGGRKIICSLKEIKKGDFILELQNKDV